MVDQLPSTSKEQEYQTHREERGNAHRLRLLAESCQVPNLCNILSAKQELINNKTSMGLHLSNCKFLSQISKTTVTF